MKKLCIIPARGQSKRFPRKNIVLINDKPLLVYSIEVALKAKLFDLVVVSTEDEEIASIAAKAGVSIHKRNPKFASDECRLTQVCLNVLEYFMDQGNFYDIFCLLQPTCPLRSVNDLHKSYALLDDKNVNYVISICEFEDSPFWTLGVNEENFLYLFFGDKYLVPRQKLPKIYRHNGSIIWARTQIFLKEKEFFKGSRAVGYKMPLERSLDIDYPYQKLIVEALLNKERIL